MTVQYAIAHPTRGVLQLGGQDRSTFLQGIVSNDVTALTTERGIWTAFLTPQGKYLYDFMLTETGDSILIEGELLRLGDLKARLLKFKLRSKITLDDVSSSYEVWQVWGETAGASFGIVNPGDAIPFAGGTALLDPRLIGLGVRLILPVDQGTILLNDRGFILSNIADWNHLRLAAGVPEGEQDLQPDKAILLENGFDELRGVSFTKGCFLGQELTARTKYRSLIKKRLLPVTFNGSAPPVGTIVTQPDGKEAGEIRSGQDGIALALLRIDALRPDIELFAAGIKISPQVPAWIKLLNVEVS